MNTEIQKLFDNKSPLPKGTIIRTTCGGIPTGGTHELPDHVLESANKVPNICSDTEPFWIHGWLDLVEGLSIPANKRV